MAEYAWGATYVYRIALLPAYFKYYTDIMLCTGVLCSVYLVLACTVLA